MIKRTVWSGSTAKVSLQSKLPLLSSRDVDEYTAFYIYVMEEKLIKLRFSEQRVKALYKNIEGRSITVSCMFF